MSNNMKRDESLEDSLPDDQESQRRLFGNAHSLSSDDFANEAPPPRPLPRTMSSCVVQYSDHNSVLSKSESIQEEQEQSGHSNTFLKRFFLRSPLPKHRKPMEPSERKTVEYPPHGIKFENGTSNGENRPLLAGSSSPDDVRRREPYLVSLPDATQSKGEREKAIRMASIFLTDYEQARPPTLQSKLESISAATLRIHRWRYSRLWRILTNLATSSFFIASCLEGEADLLLPFSLNVFAIIIFAADITMQRKLNIPDGNWTTPLIVLMSALVTEMLFVVSFPSIRARFIFSSIPKPIALFYCSVKARNALEAVGRITPIVSRVLALELLLILSFAAVACRLYSDFASFRDLFTAWLSLFQLSTTVVNPSMWMPMYNESRKAAFFFILFDTTTILYLHSLVLSVVFQTYIQASTEIQERSSTEREEAIRLAFLSLQDPDDKEGAVRRVQTHNIRKTLRLVRPHYNAMKINALVEIVDPADNRVIDYPTFRTKIQQSLSASVRSTPSRNLFAYVVEITAAVVAVTNFVYVILLTSEFQAHWFDIITLPAGFTITMLGVFELVARANPCNLYRFTPTTKLDATFDGLAALAAAVSCWGLLHRHLQLELMVTGRAIDMIRIMRFQRIFRDVVRRSGEVLPALAGPLALVVSTVHLFVYLGMSIWGGEIHVGAYEGLITPLYDLNNFNSYSEGLVTMFQVLIVNDWHAIAEVYLHASKYASPYIVYPFFVGANLVSVSIMLNCLIAFFVGAFVTKLDEESVDDHEIEEVVITRQKKRDFNIDTAVRKSTRMVSSRSTSFLDESCHSNGSSGTEVFEFDVFEREGFDKIMRTVAGGADDADAYAKDFCDMLELFERLSPGPSKLGYLVCCQQTMNRFGNRRFQTLAEHFMEVNQLHAVVSSMHAELLSPEKKEGPVQRDFVKDGIALRVSASLLRQQPAISLFVSVVDNLQH